MSASLAVVSAAGSSHAKDYAKLSKRRVYTFEEDNRARVMLALLSTRR
jgi:hypothetical protein